ncbi:MAG: nitrite/sulfite reductase, partial [Bauldia sp.]|nr:nitrite/sulfite reductase [Bauldia sp.]
AEILRQWSSLHPEFIFLPRKFKIAVTGAERDRAAIQVHDIGLHARRDESGKLGFAYYVGGGLGRTPMIGHRINDFVPVEDLLSYTEAVLRVYNLFGRRDNKYKARIKILVHEAGAGEIKRQVEEEWARIRHGALVLPQEEIRRIESYFAPPDLAPRPAKSVVLERARAASPALGVWVDQNAVPHRAAGHAIVTVSLKPIGGTPGDATADQMDLIADLAERYSRGEVRVSHEQNLILPHVALDDLPALHEALAAANLATANAGLVTDIIDCPGLDYCALANARSIPIAQRISQRFADQARQREVGDLKIKISGCINACGHHHVGHIGILGVEKKGEEFYQLTLGGSGDETASVGEIIGPGFSSDEVIDAVEKVVDTYLKVRAGPGENFLAAYRRLGQAPFKEALYGAA